MNVNLYTPSLAQPGLQPASGRTFDDFEQMVRFPMTPRDQWDPPFIEIGEVDEHGAALIATRVLAMTSGYLVFADEDVDAVAPVVGSYGDFLEVNTSRGPRQLFRPREYLGGLDEQASEAICYPDGRVMRVKSFVVESPAVAQVGVFKLQRYERGPVLYRDDVQAALVATGLFDGITFNLRGYARS